MDTQQRTQNDQLQRAGTPAPPILGPGDMAALIPSSLAGPARWVHWAATPDDDGRRTKQPFSVRDGSLASSTDPATWVTLSEALAASPAIGSESGIGIVLGDGLAGVDLDACRDPATGDIAPWARQIIDYLDSYTEDSPSETGVKIFLRGTLPPGRRVLKAKIEGLPRAPAIEMYDSGRYFTVTGRHVAGTPTTVEERGDRLRELHRKLFDRPHKGNQPPPRENAALPPALEDDTVLKAARESRQGSKFAMLYDHGDFSAYGSQSEADLALCNMLRFWTGGDRAQMDRLFRTGKLMREKWDQRRGGATYGEKTLEKALPGETYRPHLPALSANGNMPQEPNPTPTAVVSNGTKAAANLTQQLADAITAKDHFAQDAGGKLYVFRGGAYRADGEAHIRRRVKELLLEWEEGWTIHRARETVEYIRTDVPTLWDRPPLDTVNVLNGLLDMTSGQLKPHSPQFLSSVQIPVNFDAKATCPETDRFVQTTFPEDAQEVAWEIVALLMTADPSVQKAILFTGEGANGKSTYLASLTAFIGKSNTVSLSLQKLEAERFAAARILGKLANICPDLPSTHLADTSMFKAITGGDRIPAEYKHRDGFDFLPFARLVFSANHPPHSADASFAFFRRWLVIPFNRTFEEGEGGDAIPRRVLDARLADPKELSGVLNRALAALPRIRKNGITESKSMQEAWSELRRATDPLAVWIDQNTVEDAAAWVIKRDLWRTYSHDCAQHGRPPVADNGFARALIRLKPGLGATQKTVQGKVEHVWLGLGFRTPPTSTEEGPSPSSQAQNPSQVSQVSQVSPIMQRFSNDMVNREDMNHGDSGLTACRAKPVKPVKPVKPDSAPSVVAPDAHSGAAPERERGSV